MSADSELEKEAAEEQRKIAYALAAAGLIENIGDSAGLAYPLPVDALIREIVASYDSRSWGDEKVRCAICPQHQKHFKGFRVALESGEHARIGIDCGEKRFGKDAWKAASADFNRRVEIATLMARVEPTTNALTLVAPLIEEWHQRTNQLAKWLGDFRGELPELAARIATIAKQRSGRFEIEKMVWREGVNRDGRSTKYKEAETRVVGQIPYPGMFLGDTPTRGLNGAVGALREAVRMLNGKTTGLALANAFRAVQQARVYLIDADHAHAGALANLDAAWLPALCQWANQDDGLVAEYNADGGSIIHDEHRRSEVFAWLGKTKLGQSSLDKILALWP